MTLRWHQLDSAGPAYLVCDKTFKWSFAWSSAFPIHLPGAAHCPMPKDMDHSGLSLCFGAQVCVGVITGKVCQWPREAVWDESMEFSGQWAWWGKASWGGFEELVEDFLAVAHEANEYLLDFCYVWGVVLSLVGTDHILMSMKCPPQPMDLRIGPQHSGIQIWSLRGDWIVRVW